MANTHPKLHESIMVQNPCPHWTHSRISLHAGESIVVRHGVIKGGEFLTFERDVINLSQYPEFAEIHDGEGWNMRMIVDLLSEMEVA